MDERRRSTRDPTYLPGVIYFNHGRDSLSCVIRDYSYEGARIVIFDPINVPNEVELHIPERNRLVEVTSRKRTIPFVYRPRIKKHQRRKAVINCLQP